MVSGNHSALDDVPAPRLHAAVEPSDMNAVARRLAFVTEPDKCRQVARRIGMSCETVRRYFKGLNAPSIDCVARVAAAYNANTNWILLGMGAPFLNEERDRVLESAPPGALLEALSGRLNDWQSDLCSIRDRIHGLEASRVQAPHHDALDADPRVRARPSRPHRLMGA